MIEHVTRIELPVRKAQIASEGYVFIDPRVVHAWLDEDDIDGVQAPTQYEECWATQPFIDGDSADDKDIIFLVLKPQN